jgi:hypothetical protein
LLIPPPASIVPQSGFYVGIGGSLNSTDFGTQNVYAVGTSNVFLGSVRTSSGSASGPASLDLDTKLNIAFSAQGGYFQHFAGSDWLWGARFGYTHIGATSILRNALLPQAGSFTPTGGAPVAFTGNAVVQSYQTTITQQVNFVPFIGRSFERSFVYLGAGPTISQTRTNLNGLIGFADLNGVRTDVSGTPVNLTSSAWVWGGAAVVGATYFIDPTWFVDANYTFAMTGNHTSNFSSPFTNPNGTNGTTIAGTLVGTSAHQVTTQAVTVTINKLF